MPYSSSHTRVGEQMGGARGDPFIHKRIFGGIAGAVGGFIRGGPAGAIAGGIRGVTQRQPRATTQQAVPPLMLPALFSLFC